MTIPELKGFREQMKTQLPGAAAFEREVQHESKNFKESD
jgi:hypothetical protein